MFVKPFKFCNKDGNQTSIGNYQYLLMRLWMFSPSKSPLTLIGCIVSISRVTHHVAMP